MSHEPFPIADYQDGLLLPKEPWLSPRNAFRELTNGRVFRGRLQKRQGFNYFAELASGTSDSTVLGVILGGARVYQVGATEWPVFATLSWTSDNDAGPNITADCGDAAFKWAVEGEEMYPAQGPLPAAEGIYWSPIYETGTTDQIGFLNYYPPSLAAGTYFVAYVWWANHSGYVGQPTDNGEMAYRLNPQTQVVGLTRFKTTTGDFSIAADQNKLYKYNASGYYEELGPTTFTGDDEDYFWFWPFDNYLVISNGVDPVVQWRPQEPSALSLFEHGTDFTSAEGGNDLNTALLVVRFQNRAVFLNTDELAAGNVYPRRARFSAPAAYETYDSALDFLDAPAEMGAIVTAGFIGERLFVGFEEGWMELSYTGDAIAPFEWLPFISRFGAVSKLSVIRDNERLLTRSDTSMQALDPNGQYYLDEKIPDYVKEFDPDKNFLSAAIRNEDRRSFWWSYADAGATQANMILNATYDEQRNLAWSKYDMRFNVFSELESEQTPSWDSLGPLTWDDYTGVTWNDARVGIAGFVQLIGGGAFGQVVQFAVSNTDDYLLGRETIDFVFVTQELTPYPGKRAHLGWIDLYVGGITDGVLTLEFYADKSSSFHKSVTLDLTPNGSKSKKWLRVPVGRSAAFHRIRGYSSDGNATEIDAIVPYFRPAGRIRKF